MNGCIVLIFRWIVSALLLLLTAWILPGVTIEGFWAAMWISFVISLLNMFIKPFMVWLTIPVTIITFGLFILVINGVTIRMASEMVNGFIITGFWSAFWFALIYSILESIFLKTSDKKDEKK